MVIKGLNGRSYNVTSFKRWLIDWDRVVSAPQKRVKDFLRPYWSHEIVCEEYTIPGSRGQRIDLFAPSAGVVIEVSPRSSHGEYNPFLHRSLSGYRDRLKRDLQKEEWAHANGFLFCEILDSDFPLTPKLFEERFGVTL